MGIIVVENILRLLFFCDSKIIDLPFGTCGQFGHKFFFIAFNIISAQEHEGKG